MLADQENVHHNQKAGAKAPKAADGRGKGKTIEEIYQKKTQLEHILLRPDSYVGSVEAQTDKMWVFDKAETKIVQKTITYVPGLYKIFDEILVNAADNAVRDPENMDSIWVEFDAKQGCISICNNGQGLPVVMHKEHKVMVPELVFGHLLTSDNYDDKEKKVTGGRNGYGAKLTNIFSKKFIIETADGQRKLKYRQVFTENMGQREAGVTESYDKADFTKVTFWPDLERFGMEKLDEDIISLFTKRVYDMAGCSARGARAGLKVFLNGKQVKVHDFSSYVDLFLKGTDFHFVKIHEKVGERWEYVVSISDGQFQQCSFANSISTIKGGTHVAHIADQVVEAVVKKAKAKNRGGMEIKPFHVKNHIWVFVNALIENPAFDSQTKDTLTTKQSRFGSSCPITPAAMDKIVNCGILDVVLHYVKARETVDLKKKLKSTIGSSSRVMVPKLEDANDAGTKHSESCTLILTEGDSAKALAVAGLGVIGRDRYGVFPLKGKLLNVRDASFKMVTNNSEIQNLFKILNLDVKKKYTDPKGKERQSLRYGSIMIMTDQDLDGSHIKGLLVNMFQHWWPALYRTPGFLKVFATPIVKVTKGPTTKQFFTLQEYHSWKEQNADGKGWKNKYYKGLGTSTSAEAKDYFRKMQKHNIDFEYKNKECTEAIDLAFSKKRADDRKRWINGCDDEAFVDYSKQKVTYKDFVNAELVHFAKYAVHRAVPSMVDGLKPTQRKVLFCAFKRKLQSDVKVAQFVGYVSEQSAYHHGEASLETTIVNLAQDFVGANNVNFLMPSGQFGTRLMGGSDHASSRYIYTRLAPWTRSFFHPDDDQVLNFLKEEGQSIEPKHYVPILPTILVNGTEGIGTGWSSSVPNYNPREIVANLQRMLAGEEPQTMHPWYQGFKGAIVPNAESLKGSYDCQGILEKTGPTTLEITELPIKMWTQDYKDFLQKMLTENQKVEVKDKKAGKDDKAEEPKEPEKEEKDEKEPKDEGDKDAEAAEPEKKPDLPKVTIEDFKEYHTETSVHFVITLTEQMMARAEDQGLEKVFRVHPARQMGQPQGTIRTSNMVLFDHTGRIRRYKDAMEILKDFYTYRLQVYGERKDSMCEKLHKEKVALDNKVRFLLMVINGELVLSNKKKQVLTDELQAKKFLTWAEVQASTLKAKQEDESMEDDEAEGDENDQASPAGYNYLLNQPLWSLTLEKVEELRGQLATKTQQLEELLATELATIWGRDLEALLEALNKRDAKIEAEEAKATKMQKKALGKQKIQKAQEEGAELPAEEMPEISESSEDEDEVSAVKPEPVAKEMKCFGCGEHIATFKRPGDLHYGICLPCREIPEMERPIPKARAERAAKKEAERAAAAAERAAKKAAREAAKAGGMEVDTSSPSKRLSGGKRERPSTGTSEGDQDSPSKIAQPPKRKREPKLPPPEPEPDENGMREMPCKRCGTHIATYKNPGELHYGMCLPCREYSRPQRSCNANKPKNAYLPR